MTEEFPKKNLMKELWGLIDKDELNKILFEFFQEITFKKAVNTKV